MEKRIEKGKEIIKTLINSGYEAYFIGEYVRNTIIGIPFETIEITTNAIPSKVAEIFSFAKVTLTEHGAELLYYGHDFLISTFRLDEDYSDKRDPIKQHYSKNLLDELARRDFTINALAMSHNEKITDAYLGFRDIKRKRIKTIGHPKARIAEDPSRILTAVSLISELGFKVEKKTFRAIKRRKKQLQDVPIKDIYSELNKIIEKRYSRRALSFLYENNLHRYLPSLSRGFKKVAQKKFKIENVDQLIAVSAILEKDFNVEYFECVSNREYLLDTLELAYRYPKAKYTDFDLFHYGLDIALEANLINHLAGRSHNYKRKITKRFNNLVIKDIDELAFSKEDIINLASSRPVDVVYDLIDDVIDKVLKEELENDYDKIKIYCIKTLDLTETAPIRKEQVEQRIDEEDSEDFDFYDDSMNEMVNVSNESELEENLFQQGQVVKSYTEMKINQLEQRLREQERLLQEKDLQLYDLEKRTLQEKLNNDIDKIVQRNLDNLKDLNYLDTSYSEKIMLGRELKKVYRQFLSSIDTKYKQIFSEDDKNEEN